MNRSMWDTKTWHQTHNSSPINGFIKQGFYCWLSTHLHWDISPNQGHYTEKITNNTQSFKNGLFVYGHQSCADRDILHLSLCIHWNAFIIQVISHSKLQPSGICCIWKAAVIRSVFLMSQGAFAWHGLYGHQVASWLPLDSASRNTD